MTAGAFDHRNCAVTEYPGEESDQTTRYLCAAVHLDQPFCDELIDEFLGEPRRAIPPSPGVKDAVVLGDAVAARARRRLRDTVLFVLFALLAIVNIKFLIVWLVLAVLWRIVRTGTTSMSRRHSDNARLVALLAIVVLIYILYVTDAPLALPAVDATSLLVLLAMYGVLIADRLVEWRLVTTSFRRGSADTSPEGELSDGREDWWLRRVRRAGRWNFREVLEEIGTQPEDRNIIVHRDRNPFVGAGKRVKRWSMAIPLVPKESEETASGNAALVPISDKITRNKGLRFKPTEVYDYVVGEFKKLRTSLSLAPSERFRLLDVGDFVVVSADELLSHEGDEVAMLIHPSFSQRPKSKISWEGPDGHRVAELADKPIEWIRYFLCCRVESWDRDLVVSTFLHVGCDDRMLYVEWSAHVLPPIRESFREIDHMSADQWKPLRRAGGDLFELPATLPDRIRAATRLVRPRSVPADRLTASMIGAHRSIRELAAGNNKWRSFFQGSDVERYVKIMEHHTLGAIAGFLESRDISTRALLGQATTIINNSVKNSNLFNSSMSGPVSDNRPPRDAEDKRSSEGGPRNG